MTSEEQAIKITEVEHRAISNTRRIDKLEQQTDALHSLATSVELLVSEQKHQTEAMMGIKEDVAELDKKVETLEHKPAKRWESLVEKVLWGVVGAILAFILAQIGL